MNNTNTRKRVDALVKETIHLESSLPNYTRGNHTELLRIIDALIKVIENNLDTLKIFDSEAEKLTQMFMNNINTKMSESNGRNKVKNNIRSQEQTYSKLYTLFENYQIITDEVEGLHETLKGLAGIYAGKLKVRANKNDESSKMNIKNSFDKLRLLREKITQAKREIPQRDQLLSKLDDEHSNQQYLMRSAERRATTRSNNRSTPLLMNSRTTTRKANKANGAKKCSNALCTIMG